MIKNKDGDLRNDRIEMHSTMSVHGVRKIDVKDIQECGTGCWTRVIRLDTGNGYLELTSFSDDKETLQILTTVKTENHNMVTKEMRI